jgi:hypothetical protein
MKLILALSALVGASAFVVQPTAFTSTALKSDNGSYSYIPDYGNSDTATDVPEAEIAETAVPAPAPVSYYTPTPAVQTSSSAGAIATADMWDSLSTIKVQGGSLRTCSFDEGVERVEVFLKTTGRPLNANVELWQGPDNSPQKMSVYLEDGSLRPFRCSLESPGSSNSIAIRNTGQMEFPLTAAIDVDFGGPASAGNPSDNLMAISNKRIVQGGAVYTTPFSPAVQSVQITLKTDGRPLNARVELLQGPNNNKQVMEIYTEDGDERPFFAILDTPGTGNVIRIVNTATVEFPLNACVEPYITDNSIYSDANTPNVGGLTWS